VAFDSGVRLNVANSMMLLKKIGCCTANGAIAIVAPLGRASVPWLFDENTNGAGSKFVRLANSPTEIELPLVDNERPLTANNVDTDGIDMTILVFENPILRAPSASKDSAFGRARDADDTELVVFPTA
jgi:hypothetical protein